MADQDDTEGFQINRDFLRDAWCKFRPVNPTEEEEPKSRSSKKSNRTVKQRSQMTNLKEIFGSLLVDKLMSNIHYKLYNFAATE